MEYKETYNIDMYMETSAKTGVNSHEFFVEAAKILYNDFNKFKTNVRLNGITIMNRKRIQ